MPREYTSRINETETGVRLAICDSQSAANYFRKVTKESQIAGLTPLTNFPNTGVKLAIFAILQVLGPMLSDVRIAQIATLTQF